MNKKKNHYQSVSRRVFMKQMAAGGIVLAISPATQLMASTATLSSWPADAGSYRFHMIGHGHIDPVWLWPWSEGVSVAHSTFRSVLDRMNETPDLTYVSSSPQFYEWVALNDPGMLAEIRKRVEEGRWNLAGGWWIEPDVNIPSGEAMVRQGLYGQRTFERLLGRRATTAFNPDSFGHAATLPQILSLQGMENYVFMRPGPHEKTLPGDLFWWKGPDGSKILTYRIPFSYNESQSVRNRMEQTIERFREQPVKNVMAFFGVGDHGGGPTKMNISSVKEIQKEKDAPELFFSTLDRYFQEIRKELPADLPVVCDDLQHHAVGCYSAESAIKKGNRQSEAALATAEKISAVGKVAWGAAYPKEALSSAWQRVLFLQFHDSLAGTSVPEHSETARNSYGYALDTANHTTVMALQKLEWQIAAEDPGSQYLVVFNPHAWALETTVEYTLPWNVENIPSTVEDDTGKALPHQWVPGSVQTNSRHYNLLTRVTVPAMGYKQIRLKEGEAANIPEAVTASERSLENRYLKIEFFDNGTTGIYDKLAGTEVFSNAGTGCRAVVINDPSDTWSHNISTFTEETGSFGQASFKILEKGPLRAKIRVTSSWGKSKMTIDWSLYADSPVVHALVILDWQEKLKMLKFSFPVNVENPKATYEVPYGHITRETTGDEDPGQRWVSLDGIQQGNNYGLAVINDAKYGYSAHGNDLRVTVTRSAAYAHHDPWKLDENGEYPWMDQGIQTFRMMLIPGQGNWKEKELFKHAEELTAPALAIYQGIHPGNKPKSGSFLSVDRKNILIPAIKQAEDNDDIIVRCVETAGEETTAVIGLDFAGLTWSGKFRPCEIKTLRISGNTIREVNLLEE